MWFRRRDRSKADEAETALARERSHIQEVNQRGKEVKDLSEALREFRNRNHFAEQMEEILLRRRGQMR